MQVRGSLSYVGPHIVRFRVTKSKSLGLTTAWHDESRYVHSSAQHDDTTCSTRESQTEEARHASSKNGYFISQRARVPLRELRKTPPIWSIRGHVLSPFDGMHVNVLCAPERTEIQPGVGSLGVNAYVHEVTWTSGLGRSTFRRHRRDRPKLCLSWCWCVTARCSCGTR